MPLADAGGPHRIGIIEGRALNFQPGQRVILYAHSGRWYVQPFADAPFTQVGSDSRWKNETHLGTDYAALLVNPDYRPSTVLDSLPAAGGSVLFVAVTPGAQVWWRRAWFQFACVLAFLAFVVLVCWWRVHLIKRAMNIRFEERLAERTRIAQELHDTLLQSVLGASMQLQVAEELLPQESPARPLFQRVLQLLTEVGEESRNTVRALRASGRSESLEQALSTVGREFSAGRAVNFRLEVRGTSRPVQSIIRDEIYRIAREAITNAFLHSRAQNIDVELEFTPGRLRVVIRDDGHGIDPEVLRLGREGHWGLSGMRERARQIDARFSMSNHNGKGTEVELSVPGKIAFEHNKPGGSSRLARFLSQKKERLKTSNDGG